MVRFTFKDNREYSSYGNFDPNPLNTYCSEKKKKNRQKRMRHIFSKSLSR